QVVDIPEAHFCCGSAGTYNMLQPALARQLGERKAGNIESVEPQIIAAGNIGCITQIRQYRQAPIVHTVELLDWAHGGPCTPDLQGRELAELSDALTAKTDTSIRDHAVFIVTPAAGPSDDVGVW